jgi:hypothetical protein
MFYGEHAMTILLTPAYTRTYTSKPARPMLVRFAAKPEVLPVTTEKPEAEKADAANNSPQYHLRQGLINAAKVPVLPILFYYSLDATGVTDALAANGEAWSRILGEGFGHAGLCFSIHYVINAAKSFSKAVTLGRFPQD